MRGVLWAAALAVLILAPDLTAAQDAGDRAPILLSDATWQYAGAASALPQIGTAEFDAQAWADVRVPHVFQTRAAMKTILRAWYRRQIPITPDMAERHIYLIFEGAASIADVYVNGIHLGQHRGAYTRYVVDATAAIHPGGANTLAVSVDNDPADTADCLPSKSRLYKVWGGIYRKVWLVAVDPLHIDPTDYSSSGVYILPGNVTEASAKLAVKVLLRNTGPQTAAADVRATLLDPAGREALLLSGHCNINADGHATVELTGSMERPQLWSPGNPNLYHLRTEVLSGGRVVDAISEPTGFRSVEWAHGKVKINGKPTVLVGGDLHQETEEKATAVSDDDIRANFAAMQDLGFNWIRLPHYPHQKLEYDLCDQLGIACWAENGHSNQEEYTPTAAYISTEMVKQNFNHPSILVWSVGNEASEQTAETLVPVVKALDRSRPVVAANMKCKNADFVAANEYPGWYGNGDPWTLAAKGYISEVGAGGVVTTHCDYAAARKITDAYEPEEYQQLVAEALFQKALRNSDAMGMFTWWTLRDFTDVKYKKPVGINSKGLLTYAGDKKDVYYLYRCFLRPSEITVHITSQRYFLRQGDPADGIKVYSNAASLSLAINGKQISTLQNGQYFQKGNQKVDNVFYWPVPLHTGKNTVLVSDGAGHQDSAVIYFYGQNGLPESPDGNALVRDLKSSDPKNPAYYMATPVHAQWPIYYDLDSTADNSFDQIPEQVRGATWIATRRLTKPGQETDISFTLARPATVWVMCTKAATAPTFLDSAGFKEIESNHLQWRDNSLNLVPAELFARAAAAGDAIQLSHPDRDLVVMLSESK